MSSTRRLVAERSYTHLLEWLRLPPDWRALETGEGPEDRASAMQMARIVLQQLNQLLKVAIDVGDVATFVEVVRQWNLALRDNHLWGTDDYDPPSDSRALMLEQDRLMLGLVMWSAHLLAGASDLARTESLRQCLSRAMGWFGDSEQLRAAFDATEQNDEPWSTWFLGELPSDTAHFIPTRPELQRALLLTTLQMNLPSPLPLPIPDGLLRYSLAELQQTLELMGADLARWSTAVVGSGPEVTSAIQDEGQAVPPATGAEQNDVEVQLAQRVERLARRLPEAQKIAEERYREHIRASAPDRAKLEAFRTDVLTAQHEARLIARILKRVGASQLHADSEQPTPLHLTQWLPKEWFAHDSNFVSLGMPARDFGRTTQRQEFKQLVDAIGCHVPQRPPNDLRTALVARVEELRAAGSEHLLLLTPLNWTLNRELSISTVPGFQGQLPALIPPGDERSFEGMLDPATPILSSSEIPSTRVYLIDLPSSVQLEEWPAEDDSGVVYNMTTFERESAAAFLLDHPSVQADGETAQATLTTILERVLMDLKLCWRIVGIDSSGVASFAVPDDLEGP